MLSYKSLHHPDGIIELSVSHQHPIEWWILLPISFSALGLVWVGGFHLDLDLNHHHFHVLDFFISSFNIESDFHGSVEMKSNVGFTFFLANLHPQKEKRKNEKTKKQKKKKKEIIHWIPSPSTHKCTHSWLPF
eukprot:TRINITY_DN7374_c0_g1_i14.p1 TRINITY_DN7374_c0_g1~~TRINITY_DN7374_c0_g1_i14.p1  ORF type:complete len:133 (-),score=26.29 TRINITY_DN7374_c0_g1_i14:587-985(-)